MLETLDARDRLLAAAAIVVGLGLAVAVDLFEDPDSTALDITLNLLEMTPVILTSVGLALLFEITRRRHEDHLATLRDLERARDQGERWRTQARSYLNGLGDAIDEQFATWKLTAAEREVALLLLKGLSSKEVANVRTTSERTVREQARAVYAKAGLSGRAALSAFFLEDLMVPIGGLEEAGHLDGPVPAYKGNGSAR